MTGRELILALVAGYEVAVRVGMAVMPTHYRFWHSTATNGTFGAAAGAAKALKLDADAVQRTLGLAGTQAAGLNTFFESGDMTKSIHPGKAGVQRRAVGAARAAGRDQPARHPRASEGLSRRLLDRARSRRSSPRAWATSWEILQNGFKYFPSILASHAPIQATLAIVKQHAIDPAQIARITNETYNTVKSHFSNKDVSTVDGGARVRALLHRDRRRRTAN